MKIPFLIICLTVVYGACQTYGHKESIDLTEKIQNGGDYKLDYANTVLERSLSKHKRANLLSPVTTSTDLILGFDNGIRSTTISSMKDIFGVTLGQKDSKVKKNTRMGITSLIEIILFPIKYTIETIVSYILQGIWIPYQALMNKIFGIGSQLLIILVQTLYTVMNARVFTSLSEVVPQLKTVTKMFNAVYIFLQFLEYIP